MNLWMWRKRKSNSMANDSNKQRYYLMTDNWWIVDFPIERKYDRRPSHAPDVSVRACFATLNIYKLFLFIVLHHVRDRFLCTHNRKLLRFVDVHLTNTRIHFSVSSVRWQSECCFYVWNRFHRNAKGLWNPSLCVCVCVGRSDYRLSPK